MNRSHIIIPFKLIKTTASDDNKVEKKQCYTFYINIYTHINIYNNIH